MEVIKLLKSYECEDPIQALTCLENQLGIVNNINELYPRLVVLNYNQIDSPKHHPVTLECRSLVLEMPEAGDTEWSIVSRSFDRFFNYGETEGGYNAAELSAYEKMDGSLIGLFYYPTAGEWLYRTRKMIMPVTSINGSEFTWKDLIESTLGDTWQQYVDEKGSIVAQYPNLTFILEVTAPENRIVTRYKDRGITLLAARNTDGVYVVQDTADDLAELFGWNRPQTWKFESMADCMAGAKELRDLNEGYVMYDRHGAPACKVKNPAYVAAHHLRGEGVPSPKRICDLVLMNETDEYLSIFDEDAPTFAPYIAAYDAMYNEAHDLMAKYGDIESPKDFALKIKGSRACTILFRMRLGEDFSTIINNIRTKSRREMLMKYL